MMKGEMTYIMLPRELKMRLAGFKVHEREPYYSALERLLDEMGIGGGSG